MVNTRIPTNIYRQKDWRFVDCYSEVKKIERYKDLRNLKEFLENCSKEKKKEEDCDE